jgi:hypothetical protein
MVLGIPPLKLSSRRLPFLVRKAELHIIRGWFGFRGARETYGNAVGVQFCYSAALFAGCHEISFQEGDSI